MTTRQALLVLGCAAAAVGLLFAFPLTRPFEVAGWSGVGAWIWVGGGAAGAALLVAVPVFLAVRPLTPRHLTPLAALIALFTMPFVAQEIAQIVVSGLGRPAG